MISLEARNLTVTLNGRAVLRDINLGFQGPGLYFVLGQNGSGKSTLLRSLAGLIPFEGEVLLNGVDIRKYSRKELSKAIGYVWQNPLYGFFESTVEREIKFILRNLDLEQTNRFEEVIKHFGVGNFLKRSPFSLSGGEAKRVCMCSVLVADQQVYLLDEPEGELDYQGLEKLIDFVKSESKRKLIIIATHNALLSYKMRDTTERIFIIYNGEIINSIKPEDLLSNNSLVKVGIVPIQWWLS